MTRMNCVICSSSATDFLTVKHGYTVQKCSSCGHGWILNMPSPAELQEYYESESAVREQYDFSDATIRKHAARLFRWIMQVRKPPGLLLDFGCGSGAHLELAREMGWQVAGVDFSKTAGDLCARRGISVFKDMESVQKKFSEQSFEVITLWEVVEHLPDPQNFLKQIKKFLKKEGVLAVSTPNFAGAVAQRDFAGWNEIRPPMHLHYFTPQSLSLLLEKSGFYNLNQLTYGTYHPAVDAFGETMSRFFHLKASTTLLIKTIFYKLFKFHFNRNLHAKMLGSGLLSLSSPSRPVKEPPMPLILASSAAKSFSAILVVCAAI